MNKLSKIALITLHQKREFEQTVEDCIDHITSEEGIYEPQKIKGWQHRPKNWILIVEEIERHWHGAMKMQLNYMQRI